MRNLAGQTASRHPHLKVCGVDGSRKPQGFVYLLINTLTSCDVFLNCSFSPVGVKNSTDSVRDTDSPIPPVPVEFTIHIGNDIDVSTTAQEVNLKNMMNAENHVEVKAEALTSRFAGISAG